MDKSFSVPAATLVVLLIALSASDAAVFGRLAHPLAMDDYAFIRDPYQYYPGGFGSGISSSSSPVVPRRRPLSGGPSGGPSSGGPDRPEMAMLIRDGFKRSQEENNYNGNLRRMHNRKTRQQDNLKHLYAQIAHEFPFVAKQGLTNRETPDLNDLFSMTLFSQPRKSS